MTEPATIAVEYPFGETEPDAVLLASGIFRALDDYVLAINEGVVTCDLEVSFADVRATAEVTAYQFERARFASMRRALEVPKDLRIKYAPTCVDRANAPTGAYDPFKLTLGPVVTTEGLAELERTGAEMAAFEACEADVRDRTRLAQAVGLAPGQDEIAQAALRFAYLAAEDSARQLEVIWIADKCGYDDLAAELSAYRLESAPDWRLPGMLMGVFGAVSRATRVVAGLSRTIVTTDIMI